MFLYKYFLEIKIRGILLALSWVSIFVICVIYKEILLFLAIKISFLTTNFSDTCHSKLYFIFTDIKELFNVYFKLIFFITNQFSLLFFFYHFFMFFYLGLYIKEYKKLKIGLKFTGLTFVIAILLSFFLIIPLTWDFFLNFQYKIYNFQMSTLFFEAKISEYINFIIKIYNSCLYSFLFVNALFLVVNKSFSKIKPQKIKKFRKFFYFLSFLFSTIITPPDFVIQFFLSFFLILIYEIFIYAKIFLFVEQKLIRQPIKTN